MADRVAPTPGSVVTAPAPEAEVARDLIRRLGPVAPVFLVVGLIGWGAAGLASSGFALLVVAANFAAAASLISFGARISTTALAAAVLGGYVLRLGAIVGLLWLVKDAGWVEMIPLGLTLVVVHLGLLFWESRYLSISLAHPGLRPQVSEVS